MNFLKHINSLSTIFLVIFILFQGCQPNDKHSNSHADNSDSIEKTAEALVGFEIIEVAKSGITFSNDLDIETVKSPMEYINAYNGGGVAVADFNNDGLDDIYFTGNMVDNKFYVNKGDFKFEEITSKSGLACIGDWCTGATVGDINKDGFLDIYVCKSYHDDPEKRRNSLFINNGDLTFTDKAKEYGVDISSHSIHAAFLDADRDGDLDLYVGNTPPKRTGVVPGTHSKYFKDPILKWSDRFFINEGNGKFTDKTESAGFLNYGWMLGVSIADYNEDGWQDIFVAVDHSEPDLLMINNQDGTFTNQIDARMKHISASSMGTDAFDLNNDGHIDLVSLDMLSMDNYNEKTQMGSMNPEMFWYRVNNGYHYQYMRNMLQLNIGNGQFSEIGQMANIHRTDWSWAALGVDLSNNGLNDIFITNGYYRSVMDKDLSKEFKKMVAKAGNDNEKRIKIAREYPKKLKPQKSTNALYVNKGNLDFELRKDLKGISHHGFSAGAAYADFDNDGDLDLVVNNIDEPATLLRNEQVEKSKNHFLTIKFKSKNHVPKTGTKIFLKVNGENRMKEFTYSRGYQSSVPEYIHFGLGAKAKVDELKIIWFDGKSQILNNVKANQVLYLNYEDAQTKEALNNNSPFFADGNNFIVPAHNHIENKYDDYKVQVLLPHKMSQFGPHITKGDLNGDGNDDMYVGGSYGVHGVVYIMNTAQGKYMKPIIKNLEKDFMYEDMGSAIFDADGDGDMDLYVVSGGSEFPKGSPLYHDRFYINDGGRNFVKSDESIPQISLSGSCVKPGDFDKDGDLDLFVGGRQIPGEYPFAANSLLLKNEGGKFTEVSADQAIGFKELGMVTDATWADIDSDDDLDLIVVGEWMPVTVFINNDGVLENQTEKYGLNDTQGWWNSITSEDFDGDGDLDFALGNLGTNYKYQASQSEPFHVYAGDIDENGKFDIVLGQYNQNTLFPVRGLQCSSEQIPELAEKFPTYHDFGKADLNEVYGEELKSLYHLEAKTFESSLLINNGSSLDLKPLDSYAQISPVNNILVEDVDLDGKKDLILAGNFYASEVETGRADAGIGLIMLGNGKGEFRSKFGSDTGLVLDKDVRDIEVLNKGGERFLMVANNNDQMQVLKFVNNKPLN